MLQVIRTFCLAHHTRSTKNKCEKIGEYGSRGDDERLHRMSIRYRGRRRQESWQACSRVGETPASNGMRTGSEESDPSEPRWL